MSCGISAHQQKDYWITARITYYTAGSPDGDRVASTSVRKAKEGVTIAAAPKFKFGTVVEIPGLEKALGRKTFVVQDRGPDVTHRKASRGKCDVIDVFISSKKRMKLLAKTQRPYMKVHVVLIK